MYVLEVVDRIIVIGFPYVYRQVVVQNEFEDVRPCGPVCMSDSLHQLLEAESLEILSEDETPDPIPAVFHLDYVPDRVYSIVYRIVYFGLLAYRFLGVFYFVELGLPVIDQDVGIALSVSKVPLAVSESLIAKMFGVVGVHKTIIETIPALLTFPLLDEGIVVTVVGTPNLNHHSLQLVFEVLIREVLLLNSCG